MVVTAPPQQGQHWLVRGRTHRYSERTAVIPEVGHFGLGATGMLLIIFAAWGAIVPFVGPSFGYSADGAGSWHWSLTHTVVALVPGAIGVLIGLMVLGSSRGIRFGRGRFGLAGAGLLVLASGAWMAIAPWAWPVVNNQHGYFVAASPLRMLANIGGYALGPGLLMAACGTFFLGWSSRHQRMRASAVSEPVATTTTEPTAPTAAY